MKVFISSPFSHKDESIIQYRNNKCIEYSMKLLKDGIIPICPVVSGYPIWIKDKYTDVSYETLLQYAFEFLKMSDELHVLQLDGYEESSGVQKEISIAESLGMKVFYISEFNNVDNR